MVKLRWQLPLLIVLLVVAAIAGVRSVRRVAALRAEQEVCAAADRGDWTAALTSSERFVADGKAPSLAVAECRCAALMETGGHDACVSLLEGLLARPATGDWLPSPILTAVAVEARRDRGDLPGAALLAARGARRYPHDFVLLYLEFDLRSRLEDEGAVLAEMTLRLPSVGEAAPLLGLRLVERRIRREEWQEAEALLGDGPPEPQLAKTWFHLRTLVMAGEGRRDDLRATFAGWQQAGGDPAELRARYALTLSIFQLHDPEHSNAELMERAAADVDRLDPGLAGLLLDRLVGALRLERSPRAVEWYDRAVARFGQLPGLGRDYVMNQAALMGEDGGDSGSGILRFRIAGAEGGDQLLLAPGPEEPHDADYRVFPVPADGHFEVRRRGGAAPQRWVLRDSSEQTRGSGAAWVVADRAVDVPVVRRPPPATSETTSAPSGRRRPADGRRRITVVILDCGDWRLVEYLRARNELPVLNRFLDTGYRAVLDSYPAYTAVAINSLVKPSALGVDSFIGLIYQLGGEIEGLNFVGANPAAGLSWLLPSREGLFSTLGAGPLVTANLLRSFGPLQVGRQAETVGPYGKIGRLAGYRGSRPLTKQERADFPKLDTGGPRGNLLAEIAADFDTTVTLTGPAAPDLVMLRVAALDMLTHTSFADVARTGQDDGAPFLYELYRYIDRRLGEVDAALDADDVLVVMSDHGIRTALEHDRKALFVAVGGGVPRGRCPGSPALRGVGRMLADLFGVETTWPATGIETWVSEMPRPAAGQG